VEILGDYLLKEPLRKGETRLPSPEELKYKILIKGKKLAVATSETGSPGTHDVDYDEDEDDEDEATSNSHQPSPQGSTRSRPATTLYSSSPSNSAPATPLDKGSKPVRAKKKKDMQGTI